jgi:DDE family transposase
VDITIRGDSGFCREELMQWCEDHGVGYMLGFARNDRLRRLIDPQMQEASGLQKESGKPTRVFTEFLCQTTTGSWSRARRVVAKAEQIEGKENPRYVVTNLPAQRWAARALYEQLYCARGEMENRIKEQLSLFATRVSAETMRANQLRLFLGRLGLRTDARAAAGGTARHRTGAGASHDDPAEAAQDRCPHPNHGAQDLALHGFGFSAAGPLPAGVDATTLLK